MPVSKGGLVADRCMQACIGPSTLMQTSRRALQLSHSCMCVHVLIRAHKQRGSSVQPLTYIRVRMCTYAHTPRRTHTHTHAQRHANTRTHAHTEKCTQRHT